MEPVYYIKTIEWFLKKIKNNEYFSMARYNDGK